VTTALSSAFLPVLPANVTPDVMPYGRVYGTSGHVVPYVMKGEAAARNRMDVFAWPLGFRAYGEGEREGNAIMGVLVRHLLCASLKG
jgi:hypothetical protein